MVMRFGGLIVKIQLLDESDVIISTRESPKKIENIENIQIVSKEDIIRCQRVERGMPDNCELCYALNKEFFNKCNNKWKM